MNYHCRITKREKAMSLTWSKFPNGLFLSRFIVGSTLFLPKNMPFICPNYYTILMVLNFMENNPKCFFMCTVLNNMLLRLSQRPNQETFFGVTIDFSQNQLDHLRSLSLLENHIYCKILQLQCYCKKRVKSNLGFH